MHKLIFSSINSVVDIDELQRHAFNEAFRQNHLDWYWSVSTFMQLSLIRGERHRICWYAERLGHPALSMGVADKICWLKDRLLDESLASKELPLRTGIERLWSEAQQAEVSIELEAAQQEPRRWYQTLKNHYSGKFSAITTCRATVRAYQHQSPIRFSDTQQDHDANTLVISTCRRLPDQSSQSPSYDHRHISISSRPWESDLRAYIDHLGDVSNPATQLSGRNVVKDGLVSIHSLSVLETI